MVLVALTVTVTFAPEDVAGFVAVRWYVVVTVGDTVTEVPTIVPTPLSMLVELAFVAVHESTALAPAVIDAGVAVNEEITGAPCITVALQVVVATVEDASVP
jgi:hypothetical protein